MGRRDTFTGFGTKLYNGAGLEKLPEKFFAMERELERCYCAGAHLACVILARSIVEVFRESLPVELHERYWQLVGCNDDLDSLRKRRNDLLHFKTPAAKSAVSVSSYTIEKEQLESDAREACSLVYQSARAFVRL